MWLMRVSRGLMRLEEVRVAVRGGVEDSMWVCQREWWWAWVRVAEDVVWGEGIGEGAADEGGG